MRSTSSFPKHPSNVDEKMSNTTALKTHPYNFQNSETDGFQFCVTMHITVPLALLRRHGETAKSIPRSDDDLSPAHGIWVPRVAVPYQFLEQGAAIASSIGYVPRDGGKFLPYLVSAREIIECPLPPNSSDISETLIRLKKIQSLPSGPTYFIDEKFQIAQGEDEIDYFQLVFMDEDRALTILLKELKSPNYIGLSLKHILELHTKGYNSISEILNAPDDVLLALDRVGKKKLEKIRRNRGEMHNT